jgi:hypothetical protein
MSVKAKLWIAGLVVAAVGVILAKVISPRYADQPIWQLGLFMTGVLVALAGLGLIMAGARKK